MKELPALLVKNGRVIDVGDTLLTPQGKTFYVTGWDEFTSVVNGTTCCEHHYFISAPARVFGCNFSTEEI